MPKNKKRLGKMLVELGIIDQTQLETALEVLNNSVGKRIGDVLCDLGYVDQDIILKVVESQLSIPYIDINSYRLNPNMAQYVPVGIANKYKLIPLKVENGKLYVAMDDPFSFIAIDDVQMVSQMEVKPLLAKPKDIKKAIDRLYSNDFTEKVLQDITKENDDDIDQIIDDIDYNQSEVDSAPIVRLVNSIIEQAVKQGASDIHVEALENNVRVRTRVDGSMTKTLEAPAHLLPAIIARIKIMGNMNIAEKRLPLDGRAQMNVLGHEIDIRISTLPTVHGEKAVMRILDRSTFLRPKSELGFTKDNLKLFDSLLLNPHGIILITGPTGSGKSTTLYTMLSELNKETDNIITVEEPVEYMIDGLNQVNVNDKAGLTFPTTLRSILRQDPDIIMVGEIRDKETVEIAIRAAITGHLVLSTIHTNDSASTISRLIDMGVESFMLATSLVGVISQRLVKKICPYCKIEYNLSHGDIDYLNMRKEDVPTVYKGAGCSSCNNTGYRGRLAVHEIMIIDRTLREMIATKAQVDEVRDYSISQGQKTLKGECIRLFLEGITTMDEVYKVAYSGD